ncbi:hypothetical protein DUI87_02911 [Hirundo rustica rustica]|uniref:SH3 domain-containing protein n=1 Tax=Hirundo rustica rustica TaxID=333673 RepID=A0A3M0LGI0_HIRRU|nr:hypothetical protein DUI87_02911 [Hirundo rustica rustica]
MDSISQVIHDCETCAAIKQAKRVKPLCHVINEFIETERVYVEELFTVLMGYRAEMDNPAMLILLPPVLRNRKDVLFGNMPKIYDFHNKIFLHSLENCLGAPERVGCCFLDRENFQMYEKYCPNKLRSESLWRQCSKSSFFQELLKYSTSCDGVQELQEALVAMLDLLKSVNDSMHQISITGMNAVGITDNVKGDHRKFEIWYSGPIKSEDPPPPIPILEGPQKCSDDLQLTDWHEVTREICKEENLNPLAMPVIFSQQAGGPRTWTPIPSQDMKELRKVIKDSGICSSYFKELLKNTLERTHQTLKRILSQVKRGKAQATPQKRLKKAQYVYNFLNSSAKEPDSHIYRHFLNNKKSSFTCKSTKDEFWVALAKSAGSDTICLSDTSPDKPFSTCLVGVPLPKGFDNVTFDKYWPYDDHHISPTPSQNHQTYIDNSKVDKSDLQELEILSSLTMSTCYYFHFLGENGPHLNVTPYHPVYSNMTSWCNQTKLLIYDEPHTDRFNKLPIRFPKGIWLICGDRAWQGIPSKIDGGPCAMGQLIIIAPSVKKVVKKKSRRIRSSWGHQYESNCDSDFHPWNSGESIVASIFLPQLSSSIALKQLNKLGCWLSKEVNATSTMISDLLTDEEAIRHATLQNRAAIDYLLLAHGHGCEDFEGLCCMNLSDHSVSIHKQLQELRDLASQITIDDPSWLDNLFDGLSFAPWLKELCKIGLIILIVVIVVLVAVPCILQCVKKVMSKTVSNVLVVNKNGGDVGEDEAKKPYKYDCLDSENVKPVGEIELKKQQKASISSEENDSECTSPVMLDSRLVSPQNKPHRSWPGMSQSLEICEGLEEGSGHQYLSNCSDTEEEDRNQLSPGKYKALADCKRRGSEDLLVKNRDEIHLLHEDGEGQWLVKSLNRRKEGWIPVHSLQIVIGDYRFQNAKVAVTSLLENVQRLLNVKDPTSLVFHLVTFLYIVYSFSRISHTLLNPVGQQTETREQGDKSVIQAAAKPDSEAKTPAVAAVKKGKKHTDKTDRPVDDDSGEGSSMPPDTQSGVKPPDTQSEAEATDDTQSETEPTDRKSEAQPAATRSGARPTATRSGARPTAARAGDTIESFSLKDLRGLRKDYTRRPDESIISWLVRLWDAAGEATILDGTEARHLGSLSHDPVINQEMMREASPCSLWEQVLGTGPGKCGTKISVCRRSLYAANPVENH